MKLKTKCVNCLSVGFIILIIVVLAYAINLGRQQQKTFNEMAGAIDRIIINVNNMELERLMLEKENKELKAMEDKTTEDMEEIELEIKDD